MYGFCLLPSSPLYLNTSHCHKPCKRNSYYLTDPNYSFVFKFLFPKSSLLSYFSTKLVEMQMLAVFKLVIIST